MQTSEPISKKISQNREIFRSQIRNSKTDDLFQSKRLKYQSIEDGNPILISDNELISQLLDSIEIGNIKNKLEELGKRTCNLEQNSKFFKNDKLFILIPTLIKYLEDPQLQYNSCWILINLLIGDTNLIKFCINSGLLTALLKIIERSDAAMREQALWGISNMAGDSLEVISIILKEKAIEKILNMLKNLVITVEISKNVIWFLVNILRWNYKGEITVLFNIIHIILENNFYEEELFENCTCALDKIAKQNPDIYTLETKFDDFIPIFTKIIFYFNNQYFKLKDHVISFCLNFFGIFLVCNDTIIEEIVFLDICHCYQKTIQHNSHKIRQATLWALGNIFCSNSNIIDYVFTKNSSIFPIIIQIIQTDTHFKVKNEAIICLSNLVSICSANRLTHLLELNLQAAIISILDIYNPDLLLLLLDMLEEIFKFGECLSKTIEITEKINGEANKKNPLIYEFKLNGGTKKLEALLEHNNSKIKEKCLFLLDILNG